MAALCTIHTELLCAGAAEVVPLRCLMQRDQRRICREACALTHMEHFEILVLVEAPVVCVFRTRLEHRSQVQVHVEILHTIWLAYRADR